MRLGGMGVISRGRNMSRSYFRSPSTPYWGRLQRSQTSQLCQRRKIGEQRRQKKGGEEKAGEETGKVKTSPHLTHFNPLWGTLKLQSNGPLCSNTLNIDGSAVTFGRARTSLGRPNNGQYIVYQLHIFRCGTIIASAL